MMGGAAAVDEIAWVQAIVDEIVANEPPPSRIDAVSRSEAPAGAAGVLELEALDRAAAPTTASPDVLFGMAFLGTGDTLLIGLRTITDATGEPVVVDWRAPVGARFFQCSVEDPLDVVVRRRVRCRGAEVIAIDDEHLMPEITPPRPLVGEGALLADPVTADASMAPVIATLRHDQDGAVRAPRRGDTLVIGPPGTGKTVVALNRASYLDYADRGRMFDRHPSAYLVPTQGFATYVAGVLPALGDASTRLAPMPQLLVEIATLVLGPGAALLARDLDRINPGRLGSGRARRRWRSARLARATGWDAVVRSRNGLLYLPPARTRRLVEAAAGGSWAASRRRLTTALVEVGAQGHPASEPGARREAAREITDLLLPPLSVPAIVEEILDRERTAGPAGAAPTSTALGALLMLVVEHGGSRLLRERVWTPIRPPGAADDLPADADVAFEWHGNSLAEMLASAFAYSDAFRSRQEDLWRGGATANPWAFDHLIVDECQDQAPEVLRALRRTYPAAGRTFIGDLAQSGTPRWYRDVDALMRAAGSTRPAIHQLSHNYRNDRSIADHVAEIGTAIEGALATVAVRPRRGDLRLHRTAAGDLDPVGIAVDARARGAVGLWLSDSPTAPPGDLRPAATVKGHEFPDVVVVVDPASAPTETLIRALYVAVSRAVHRCDVHLPT